MPRCKRKQDVFLEVILREGGVSCCVFWVGGGLWFVSGVVGVGCCLGGGCLTLHVLAPVHQSVPDKGKEPECERKVVSRSSQEIALLVQHTKKKKLGGKITRHGLTKTAQR